MVNIIRLEQDEHLDFLNLELKDPETNNYFKFIRKAEGFENLVIDEEAGLVVQCGECQTVYFYKSWVKIGGQCKHCASTITNSVLAFGRFKGNPEIIDFSCLPKDKECIEGEPILLSWKVRNATDIFLNGNQIQSFGEEKIKFLDQDTKFILRAENPGWFRNKQESTLFIKPAEPKILNFETDHTNLKKGQPIKVTFDIKNASRFELIQEVGYDRKVIESGKALGKKIFKYNQKYSFDQACSLWLYAWNGTLHTEERIPLEVAKVQIIRDLETDKRIITTGASIKLKWEVENATRIEISDGTKTYPTKGNTHEYQHNGEEDFSLSLIAFGDFGQQVSGQKIQIRTARIANFRAFSNNIISDPKFYLSWEGSYLSDTGIILSPPPLIDRRLRDSEERIEISRSSEPIEYTLKAWSSEGREPIEKKLVLYPPTIHNFQMEGGEAILGMPAIITWDVEDARKITIDGQSGKLVEKNPKDRKHRFDVQEVHRDLTLTVWGDTEVVQSSIEIQIFRPPQISDIRLPLLQIRLQFDFSKLQVPPFPFFGKQYIQKHNNTLPQNQAKLANLLRPIVRPSEIILMWQQKWRLNQIQQRRIGNSQDLLTELRHVMRNTAQELGTQIRNRIKSKQNG